MIYDPPNRNPGKPIRWIIFDSAIIGLLAFAASLPYNRIPDQLDIYIALRAFLYSFATQLVVEYGIKPWWKNRNNNNNHEGGG